MHASVSPVSYVLRRAVAGVVSFAFLLGCGSGGTATTASGGSGSTTTTNAYATAYKSATFASGVTATITGSCSMTITASGAPYSHAAYYLAPIGTGGGTAVATTASGIQLMVVSYAQLSANLKAVSGTFNICPTKASTTTTAGMGAIGVIFSGNALFNPYEATGTVAMGDNASYTFTQNGTTYTAQFLDTCAAHPNGGVGASTWHHHANPTCWTSVVDGANSGPSHMIGIALDGFPIYGGRDVNGNIVDSATLDSCNGITSATPEFPSGAYHYVLPIQSNGQPVTTSKSSLNCYSGTVNATLSAQMKKLACKMPMLMASGKMRLPDGRMVSRNEAVVWMKENMPDMQSTPGMVMAGGESHHAGHRMSGM